MKDDENRTEKRRKFIIDVLYWALVLLIVYVAIKYVVVWVMPFLLGLAIALLLRPLIGLIDRRTRISYKPAAFVLTVLSFVVIGLLLWLGGYRLFVWLKEAASGLPEFYNHNIDPFLEWLSRSILDFAQRFSPELVDEVADTLNNIASSIKNLIVSLSTEIISYIANLSTKVPLFLISLVFTVLSALFISMDYREITAFVKKQLPQKQIRMLLDIKDYLGKTLLSYVRAYLILMVITFMELSVGLLILGVKNALGIAAGIAFADAFPVLGTGTIVIPWAALSLFQGKFYLAVGLILLYLIVTVVRQFIEPKVVGDQLGLPPVVAIICIYLGFVWFGIFGAILFPVTMNIIVSLHRAGKIHLWN